MEFVSEKYYISMDSLWNQTEICLGLPLAYYTSKKRRLAQRLSNFEVLGCKVNPLRLAIQAQGQGILLDFLLDDQCRPNRKWVGNDLLILDIGFKTIDILCVHEGRSSSEWSNMLEGAGICRICKDLEIELRRMGIRRIERLELLNEKVALCISKADGMAEAGGFAGHGWVLVAGLVFRRDTGTKAENRSGTESTTQEPKYHKAAKPKNGLTR